MEATRVAGTETTFEDLNLGGSSCDDTLQYSEKSQLVMLLKKKQEIVMNKINVKRTFFEKIKSKQQEIIEFARSVPEDRACIYNIMSLIKDLK